jgi:exosortase
MSGSSKSLGRTKIPDASGEKGKMHATAADDERRDDRQVVNDEHVIPGRWQVVATMAALTSAFLWSYWPTLKELVDAWKHQPDYSHGWLVAPAAAYFLWQRRADCPRVSCQWAWGGLALVVASLVIRVIGSLWFLTPLAGWSIPLWLAGACWFLGGGALARWAMPGIAFLVFMIPLPFRSESLLSGPLQAIAARWSGFALQCLGEPVIREGNVLVIGDQRVAVAEACSGLRIFISIVALAFAFLLLTRISRRVKIGLLIAVLPIALVTNAARIVVTAWLQVHGPSESARHFSHDAAGWLMLPFALALMAATVAYCERLAVPTYVTSAASALKDARMPSGRGRQTNA